MNPSRTMQDDWDDLMEGRMNNDIPQAIHSGTIKIFGVDIDCHVLDNGQRIIGSESVNRLFSAMATGVERDDAGLEAFSRFIKTGELPEGENK